MNIRELHDALRKPGAVNISINDKIVLAKTPQGKLIAIRDGHGAYICDVDDLESNDWTITPNPQGQAMTTDTDMREALADEAGITEQQPHALRDVPSDNENEGLIVWLRDMAQRGGKGGIPNVDARALGRVADALTNIRNYERDRAAAICRSCIGADCDFETAAQMILTNENRR